MVKKKWTKKEIKEYRKIHNAIFYYNNKDANFIVPKGYGIGWSFNWANTISWIFALAIVWVIALYFLSKL